MPLPEWVREARSAQAPMLTALTMLPAVRAQGLLSVEGGRWRVRVYVLDVRQRWGAADLLVAPVAGEGQAWVSAERVALEAPAT